MWLVPSMKSCLCFIWCPQGDPGERGPQGFKGPKGEVVSQNYWFVMTWNWQKCKSDTCMFSFIGENWPQRRSWRSGTQRGPCEFLCAKTLCNLYKWQLCKPYRSFVSSAGNAGQRWKRWNSGVGWREGKLFWCFLSIWTQDQREQSFEVLTTGFWIGYSLCIIIIWEQHSLTLVLS